MKLFSYRENRSVSQIKEEALALLEPILEFGNRAYVEFPIKTWVLLFTNREMIVLYKVIKSPGKEIIKLVYTRSNKYLTKVEL